jgi:hypothetical protein
MIDIVSFLPVKRKHTPSGWISFNAVCCTHNGNNQDKRQRGGLKAADQGWSYHCFNCGYTASFILGRTLSYKARKLLSWLHVPDSDIEYLNLESLKHRNIHGIIEDRQKAFNALSAIEFEERDLPPFAELLVDEGGYRDYVRQRCVPEDFPVMVQLKNDGIHWVRPHVVIPFTHDNKIVGWTCRFLDNKQPKFISDSQPGYVFGTDLQQSSWQHVLVMEGIFDALSIDGLAVMHNTISDAQARLIRSIGKEITVVPDQDSAGLELISRALELGWSVSIPEWPQDVKDVNDAVIKFGKTATLMSILQHRDRSPIKIAMRQKWLQNKINKNVVS